MLFNKLAFGWCVLKIMEFKTEWNEKDYIRLCWLLKPYKIYMNLESTFQISAMSCCDAFKSLISMHITKNLSLSSNNVMFGPGCSTTLIFILLPGGSIPVLGRTRNLSGDVVLIYWKLFSCYEFIFFMKQQQQRRICILVLPYK